jgi:alcohol dehydrogenase
VLVSGHGPRDASRLEAARAFGADLTVDVAVDDPVEALRDAGVGLVDVVVDVTANAPSALAQAVALARPGGTVVLAGMRGTGELPGFRPDAIVLKELRVLGALGVDVDAYRSALDLVASGRHPFAGLARQEVGLETVGSLLATMAGEGDAAPPIHGVVRP